MQQCAYIYLLLNYSTCFGRQSRPLSEVHTTVVAASGTDHTIWGASFLKRDLWSRLRKLYCMFPSSYAELVRGTNFKCTKWILHKLSILHHASAHHTCHHQGVFVVVITAFLNCPFYV